MYVDGRALEAVDMLVTSTAMVLWVLVLLPLGSLAAAAAASSTEEHGDRRQFTVQDSIEMASVAPADYSGLSGSGVGRALSPDRQRFYLVVTRGAVQREHYESTLWVYEVEEVLGRLQHEESLLGVGRAVLRRASRTRQFAIRKVSWSEDSRRLALIADEAASEAWQTNAHLYEIDLQTRQLMRVSPVPFSVVEYARRGSRFVYSTESTLEPFIVADRARRLQGFTLSGESQEQAMEPGYVHSDWTRVFDTYLTDLAAGDTRKVVEPPALRNQFTLDLWPDDTARWAIGMRPIAGPIPQPWRAYSSSAYSISDAAWLSQSKGGDPTSPEVFTVLPMRLVVIDTHTGTVRALLDAPTGIGFKTGEGTPVLWAPDSRTAIVAWTFLPLSEPELTEAQRAERKTTPYVAEVNIQTGRVRPIRPMQVCTALAACERVARIAWGARHGSLQIDGTDVRGHKQTWLYELRRSGWTLTTTRPGSPPDVPASNLRLSIHESLSDPPTLWAEDARSGRSALLLDPNPALKHIRWGRSEELRWTTDDGRELRGALLWPTRYVKGERYPLVIQTHGYKPGNFLVDGPATTAFAARALAARAMFVVQMQNLNDSEISLTPREAPAHVRAYEAVVKLLSDRGLVDAARVGLIGWSRTSYHVKYALAHSPMEFAAATAADGVDFSYSNLLWAYPTWHELISPVYEGLPLGQHLAKWTTTAPAFNVHMVRAPLRIETMTKNALHRDWEMYAMLKMAGKPVELVYFPEGNHSLIHPAARLTSQQGNVDWFDFWLNGREDPEQAKAEQYRRWRALREQRNRR